MDPNKTLAHLLKLAKRAIDEGSFKDYARLLSDHEEMAELFISLHEWIQGGGFLPKDWWKGVQS